MRVQNGSTGANQVHYLFADHLSSSNVSHRGDGGQTVTQRYYPWGTVRPGPNNALPTGYTYTGQPYCLTLESYRRAYVASRYDLTFEQPQ